MVKIFQESLVKRDTGTENGGKDNRFVNDITATFSQRRIYNILPVSEGLAYLICHYLANTRKVLTETQHVALYINIAHLHQILTHKRWALTEIDYLHVVYVYILLIIQDKGKQISGAEYTLCKILTFSLALIVELRNFVDWNI